MLTVKKIINNRLWVSAVLAMVIALVIIPVIVLFIAPKHKHEPNSLIQKEPKGTNVKAGDWVFYSFIENVKEQNAVLVLGTSETGSYMSGNNYYHLLDRDQDLEQSFYSFGGAGRTANVYFPLILNNPSAFKNLNIILYINPTYWRKGLNDFSLGYFERYVELELVKNVEQKAKEIGVYEGYMMPVDNILIKYGFNLNHLLNNYRSIFYYDLVNMLGFQTEKEKVEEKVHTKVDLNHEFDSSRVERIRNTINLTYNVTDDYLSKKLEDRDFPEIDSTSTFQSDVLKSFIKLTKLYDINCVFYLGPINQVYCEKIRPERLDLHLKTVAHIRSILEESDVPYIDGTSLSTVPGTFIDIQHISEYGAYLTELQIKEYYEKNK